MGTILVGISVGYVLQHRNGMRFLYAKTMLPQHTHMVQWVGTPSQEHPGVKNGQNGWLVTPIYKNLYISSLLFIQIGAPVSAHHTPLGLHSRFGRTQIA